MLYIAYGSNMSREHMLERCPGAKFYSAGILEHYVLQFHYKANIERAHDYETPVVVWDIPEGEIEGLDAAEGVPKHYRKIELEATPLQNIGAEKLDNGDGDIADFSSFRRGNCPEIRGFAYVMTDWKKSGCREHDKQTSIEYAGHIITGYRENNFTGRHLQDLWCALYRAGSAPERRS